VKKISSVSKRVMSLEKNY